MESVAMKKNWLGFDIFPIPFRDRFPTREECKVLATYWLDKIENAEDNTPCLHIYCPNSIDMILEFQNRKHLVVAFYQAQKYLTCAALECSNEYEIKCQYLLDL